MKTKTKTMEIIFPTKKPKSLFELNSTELETLFSILSDLSIAAINTSPRILFRTDTKIVSLANMKIEELNNLRRIISAIRNHTIIPKDLTDKMLVEERKLIAAMYSNSLNQRAAARDMEVSLQHIRTLINNFKIKWGLDLTILSDLLTVVVVD